MKKWVMGLVATLLLSCAFPIAAIATQPRALAPSVTLNFNGTTAYCSAVVIDVGKTLDVKMELRHGNVVIGSWSASDEGMVAIEGKCPVVKGQTYTLIVTGTTNGKPFSSTPFSRTC